MAFIFPRMRGDGKVTLLAVVIALHLCASTSARVHLLARSTARVLTLSTADVVQDAYRARGSEITVPARQDLSKQRNRRMEPGAHRPLDASVAISETRASLPGAAAAAPPATPADRTHVVDDGLTYRSVDASQGIAKPHQRQVLRTANAKPTLHGEAMDMMDDDERLVLLKDIHSSDEGSLFHPLSDPEESKEDTEYPQAVPAQAPVTTQRALEADPPCSTLPSGCSTEPSAPSFIRRWLHMAGTAAPDTRATRQLVGEPSVSGKPFPGHSGEADESGAYSHPFGALGLFSGAIHPTGVRAGFGRRASLQ